MKIAVLGLWHLGEIYSTCLTELGHDVVGISEDGDVIANLKRGVPPLAEPRLAPMLKKHLRSGRLRFSSLLADIRDADVLWVTFDTPVDSRDRADTQSVLSAMRRAVRHLKPRALVVVSSQLPVGTSKRVMQLIGKRPYAYVPENLRLGEGIESFMHPGRVVIGASTPAAGKTVENLFAKLRSEVLHMDPASAEMVKHALNAFLATSLSFIYDIADACEREGADVLAVSRALKSDPRIGRNAYLDASLGFAGGTLGRDLQFLQAEARRLKFKVPVIAAAYEKNRQRRALALDALSSLGRLKGKRIAVLGLTYKAGTTTLRRSMALEIAETLAKKGARLSFYDPSVSEKMVQAGWKKHSFRYGKNLPDTLAGAHAAILIMPWKELADVSWNVATRQMKKPKLFFDTRNALASSASSMRKAGIQYRGLGRAIV